MSLEMMHTPMDINAWGGTFPEVAINRRDLISIKYAEDQIGRMAAGESVGVASIDWYEDTADGSITGRVCDNSDWELSLVLLSGDRSKARLVSGEALLNERAAKIERNLAAAFAGGIALDAIMWPTDVAASQERFGAMMVNVNTPDNPIYLMTPTQKIEGTMRPAAIRSWRVITGPEWARLQASTTADKAERPPVRPSGRLVRRSAEITRLEFDRVLSDKDGQVTYRSDDKVPRWADRDQSRLVYNSRHIGFLAAHFEQSMSA